MRTLFAFLLAGALSSVVASAASIQFTQDGWSTGATLSVAFSGEDTDADGAITQLELTSFSAMWATPSAVASAWGLPNIEPGGFFFTDLDNYVFFVSNPSYSLVSTAFEGEALASVFDEFLFPVDSTVTPPAAVPEPAALTLAGAGLAILAFCRWKLHPRTAE